MRVHRCIGELVLFFISSHVTKHFTEAHICGVGVLPTQAGRYCGLRSRVRTLISQSKGI